VNFSLAGVARDREPMHAFIFVVADNFFGSWESSRLRDGSSVPTRQPNANIQVVVASYGLWQRMGGGAVSSGPPCGSTASPHGHRDRPGSFSGISGLLAPSCGCRWAFIPSSTRVQRQRQVLDLNNPKNYTLNVMARLAPG
jgi:hypothetical protein